MFGEVLKKLRKDAGMSQGDLADAIGMSKSAVGMYEQGKRTPHNKEVLKAISDCFNVTVDYLYGFTSEGSIINDEDRTRFGLRAISTKKIPMIGKIACGEPIMCEQDYETFIEASSDIDADFCLTAQGDSMINARIFDGDVVFIREQQMVENGEIAAVIVDDNEVTLKRFFYYPDRQQVILQPENPTFKPLVFNNEELNHIRILGKAVAFMSKVN